MAILGVAAGTAISTLAGTCQRGACDGGCKGESLSSDLRNFVLVSGCSSILKCMQTTVHLLKVIRQGLDFGMAPKWWVRDL